MIFEGTNGPILLSLSVTCDGPLSLCETAPKVIHRRHQQYELPLEARQLVPPVMPMCHVLGALQTSYLSLLFITVVEDMTCFVELHL